MCSSFPQRISVERSLTEQGRGIQVLTVEYVRRHGSDLLELSIRSRLDHDRQERRGVRGADQAPGAGGLS